jgi:hypothetical protein
MIFYCDPDNPFARFGGGGSDVNQAPTHTQPWGQLEEALINMAAPFQRTPRYDRQGRITGYTQQRALAQPEYYPGERLAEMDPSALLGAQNAMQGIAGGMMDFYDPIYERAINEWEQEIAPSVMERFAGMGNAMSGGAASALSREGQNLLTGISAEVAPLYQEALFQMPALAGWEQQARQQPLDLQQQLWAEEQNWPQVNPYWNAAQSVLGGGGSQAMESYAEPGTDWGSVGGNLGSAGILAAGLAKSDRRWKENFANIPDALVKLKQLKGQIYNFKNVPDERRAGLIAQDIQAVLPEAVEDRPDGLYIRLDGIVALLVNAVNELAEQITASN